MKKNVFLMILTIIAIIVLLIGNNYYNGRISNATKTSTTSIPTQAIKSEKQTFSPENIFIYSLNGSIDVYISSSEINSDKYIGYHVDHSVKGFNKKLNSSNYDVWNLSGANEFRRTSENGFMFINKIVTTGEWDLALREKGANDFVGGVLHGDEITTDIELYIDNEKVDPNVRVEKEAKEIKIIIESDLYRDNTITDQLEKIAVHNKTYTFDKDGLIIDQGVIFNQSLELERSYLAMLPILRKSDGKTGSQITDKITTNYDNREYDVPEEGFKIPELTNVEANIATISGELSGISATVEIIEKSPKDAPSTFTLSNAPYYNKFYFTFIEDGHRVVKDEVWSQTTKYKIDTLN